jgi:hypothetical protein
MTCSKVKFYLELSQLRFAESAVETGGCVIGTSLSVSGSRKGRVNVGLRRAADFRSQRTSLGQNLFKRKYLILK